LVFYLLFIFKRGILNHAGELESSFASATKKTKQHIELSTVRLEWMDEEFLCPGWHGTRIYRTDRSQSRWWQIACPQQNEALTNTNPSQKSCLTCHSITEHPSGPFHPCLVPTAAFIPPIL